MAPKKLRCDLSPASLKLLREKDAEHQRNSRARKAEGKKKVAEKEAAAVELKKENSRSRTRKCREKKKQREKPKKQVRFTEDNSSNMSSWFGLTAKTPLPKVDPLKTPLPTEDSSENAKLLKTATKLMDTLVEAEKDDDALFLYLSQNQKHREQQDEQRHKDRKEEAEQRHKERKEEAEQLHKERKEQAEQQAREAEMLFEMQRSKLKCECHWASWTFSATLFELNCHAVASNNLFGFPRPREFAWNC